MYFNLHKLRTISLRYFNVYGPRQPLKGIYAPVIGLFQEQHKRGEALTIVGDGNQRRDFTHVSDVVDANVAAIGTFPEAWNLSIREEISAGVKSLVVNDTFISINKTIRSTVVIYLLRPFDFYLTYLPYWLHPY